MHSRSQDKLDKDDPDKDKKDKKKEKRNSKHQEIFDKELRPVDVAPQGSEAVILSETVIPGSPATLTRRAVPGGCGVGCNIVPSKCQSPSSLPSPNRRCGACTGHGRASPGFTHAPSIPRVRAGPPRSWASWCLRSLTGMLGCQKTALHVSVPGPFPAKNHEPG